ncbi:AlpA family phage regulatory protein [Mesorhizobium sp. M0437]|uniref:helix-turn-helix transcriptional regulator n=1 Tax=Mesorhizobium sp. M0437 TaxID=2956945 RepID=UPI0033372969
MTIPNEPERLLRLSAILAPKGPLPISKSHFWQGVRDGRYPAPFKLSKKVTVWKAADIAALVANLPRGEV